MTMRPPGDEFWDGEGIDIVHELFDNQVIRDAKVGGAESPVGKCQVDTVHAKGDLILQLTEIGLFQAGTVPHNKGALPLVTILHFRETPYALTTPGMKIGIRKLGDTAKGVVGIAGKVPGGSGYDGFECLFHFRRNSW